MKQENNLFVTQKELVEILGLSTYRVDQLCKVYGVRQAVPGSKYRIYRYADVQAMIAKLRGTPQQEQPRMAQTVTRQRMPMPEQYAEEEECQEENFQAVPYGRERPKQPRKSNGRTPLGGCKWVSVAERDQLKAEASRRGYSSTIEMLYAIAVPLLAKDIVAGDETMTNGHDDSVRS